MSKQQDILKAASALPPAKARRVAAAIAAAEAPAVASVPSVPSDPDALLEAAAAAMQRALEAAILPELEAILTSDR